MRERSTAESLTPTLTPAGMRISAIWCPLVRTSRIQTDVAELGAYRFESLPRHHRSEYESGHYDGVLTPTVTPAGLRINASRVLTASRCIVAVAWLYRSSVIAVLA